METFALEGHEHVALCDLLKILGWCDSGAMAKAAVGDGLVTVDGALETRKRCKIVAGQVVSFEGRQAQVVA